ncbi:hypothetical protein [Thermococcus barossii]|nr:hypothetical protein [Thermococcus barossii]
MIMLILLLGFMGFIVLKGLSGDFEYVTKYFDIFFVMIVVFVVINSLLRFTEENIHLDRKGK